MSKYVKLQDVVDLLRMQESEMRTCSEMFADMVKERGRGRLGATTFEGAAYGIHHATHRIELDLKSIDLPDNLIS